MNVLALQKQSKFIKKTITLPNGSLALVVFELVEINGKITAKAVCGKLIEENIISQEEILALPVYVEIETIEPIVSPFFADILNLVKDLSFVISQPSRAPNF
jgi:hypothetical protein